MVGRHPSIWGAVFGLGILGIAWLERQGLIGWPWNVVLVGVVSLTLIPLGRAMRHRATACGTDSPAMRAYTRRSMIWAVGYIVLLGVALTARNTWHPQGPVLWFLALLPSLPILYLIWSMGRYLVEEQDEYLRMRQIQAGLIATGLLLVVATVWGFLETFGIAPHAESWWAVAVWALGQGLGGAIQNLRDRQDREP